MRSFTALFLAASLIPSLAPAQTVCSPHTPGGVVVTEGRGGANAGLVASASQGVGLVWRESITMTGQFAGASGSNLYMRSFDARTLAPRAAAQRIYEQEAPYMSAIGPVAVARGDGSLGALLCECAGGGDPRVRCDLLALRGDGGGVIRPEGQGVSGCPSRTPAATAIGAEVLVALDYPDARGIRMHGTAVRAMQDVEMADRPEASSMAAIGGDRAVFAARIAGSIQARVFDVRGNSRSRPTTLSAPRTTVGAPFALSQGAGVLVAFSQRSGRGPWRVQLVSWTPGSPPARTEIQTGSAPAMAPSLAPASGGCVMLSWTEGQGRGTVARVGRVCNGALEAASVAQLSRPGLEAGDSELASDGANVFAVWQEIPAARGARPELRLTRLGCR